MGLDCIIRPEIKEDEFYTLIQDLSKTEKLESVLEIGSSCGGGSTEAFVSGLLENKQGDPKLFCLEVSKTRCDKLVDCYKNIPFVRGYNSSSVLLSEFSSVEQVIRFYCSRKTALNNYPLDVVLGWWAQDTDYINREGKDEGGIERIKKENGIDYFDMVLIDGSEFTGISELNKLYGAKIFLLDDINSFKNYSNYWRLVIDKSYQLVAQNWYIRNGYAVFRRI